MDRRHFLGSLGAIATLPAGALGRTPPTRAPIDPAERTIAELAAAQAAGHGTAASIVAAYLQRIERLDRAGPALRAVLATNPHVLEDAHRLDAERRAGRVRGPLHGIPLLIKDNIATADPVPTTAGSLALARSAHALDAPLVARLRAAGALVLGKANLSEWANYRSTHSLSGWSGVGGQTRNAYDRLRNPSGSSSGSAVGVAASLCAAAIGSETDGSILAPSALNGCVGLKPTAGLVSGTGVVPLSPRQDTAGPIGRTVADVAALAAVIAEQPLGYGPQGADLDAFRLAGVRLGWIAASPGSHPESAPVFAAAHGALAGDGAVLVELEAPKAFGEAGDAEVVAMQYEFHAAIDAYLGVLDPALVSCRSLADLVAFNRAHATLEMPLFGQEIFEAALARGPLTEPAYLAAREKLDRCYDRDGLAALFTRDGVEVLAAPGNGPAELIDTVWGERPGDGGWPAIASAAAIAGYPSLTVPAGLVRGLPVGLVLVGRRGQDGLLLQVANAFERATRARRAPVFATSGCPVG
jgi:amidase